jgi:CRISPR/Cas system endoribonuclease Cas6 (RAMP superfamily)
MNLSKLFGRNKFKSELKKTLKHKYVSYWNNIKQIQGESGKLSTHFQIKTGFTTEKYFELKNIVNRSIVAKFRISAHRLRIEMERYERIRNSQGNLAM